MPDSDEVQKRLADAMQRFNDNDAVLLRYDAHETCIEGRLAMYLQAKFPDYSVDIEYSRAGARGTPKTLGLPYECGKRKHGVVRPEIVVHRRGDNERNLLVLELKKFVSGDKSQCDQKRIQAFREKYAYAFGATITCQMVGGVGLSQSRWFDNAHPNGRT
jgi:hypothetical protein